MQNSDNKHTKRELLALRKAATRAIKKVEKSAKNEPSVIITTGESNISESTVSEITNWLFHRRQDDGSTGD